jgi:sugar phosphate isomerase/epimerase
VALEVIPNGLSTPAALVSLIEDELDLTDVGICMDFGHGGLSGDPVDAVETASGHVITTHVHDNLGRTDDHLVPFEGSIDWPAVLMAMEKIGYDGLYMLEVRNTSAAAAVLERARAARIRLEAILKAFPEP